MLIPLFISTAQHNLNTDCLICDKSKKYTHTGIARQQFLHRHPLKYRHHKRTFQRLETCKNMGTLDSILSEHSRMYLQLYENVLLEN